MDKNRLGNVRIDFIVGPGRSGTTMLMHMLNVHRNCIATPEVKHLLYFADKYKSIKVVSAALINDVHHFLKIVTKRNAIFNLINFENFISRLELKEGEGIDYLRLCRRIYFLFNFPKVDSSAVNVIIDKNPVYTMQVEAIRKLLPDSRFLCMLRDYRAYVVSNIQKPGKALVTAGSVRYHALVWYFYAKEVQASQKRNSKENYKVIRYEDLVADKETKFREVCDFFSLEYDERCFQFNTVLKETLSGTDLSQITDQRVRTKLEDLTKPVNVSRVDSWRSALTPEQIKVIEFWCGNIGRQWGYEPTTELTGFEKINYLVRSIPAYFRVWLFFKLRSVKLDFYLNDKKRAGRFTNEMQDAQS